jgi:AraC-like DNA-binding protein
MIAACLADGGIRMQPIPMSRSSSVRPFLDYLEHIGASPGPSLAGARALLCDPTALIPVPIAGTLIDEAKRAAGDEAFGLHAGAATPLLEFGDWGAVLSGARTVGGLVATIVVAARRFSTGQHFWTEQRGDVFQLHWQYTSRLTRGRSVASEFALMMLLQAIRLAAGPDWRPDEIHLEGRPPRHAAELEALASKRIVFGQPHAALVFSARLLAERVPFIPFRRPQPGALVPAGDFAGSMRQVVGALLKLGVHGLARAAEAVQMSERSLQRRLAESGLSFAQVVEDARFDSARRMLGDPARKIVEISAELGYSDSANFTRAFRRWSGVSPQAFRKAG